jgi:hypothetical protein
MRVFEMLDSAALSASDMGWQTGFASRKNRFAVFVSATSLATAGHKTNYRQGQQSRP